MVRQIVGGAGHTVVLLEDGRMWGSGSDEEGQLGGGVEGGRSGVFVRLEWVEDAVRARVCAVAAGWEHTLVLTEEGRVYGMGSDSHGQSGKGAGSGGEEGVWEVDGLEGIVGFAAGLRHSLAWDREGRVWGWGQSKFGQLGVDPGVVGKVVGVPIEVPVEVQVGRREVVGVGAGYKASIVVQGGEGGGVEGVVFGNKDWTHRVSYVGDGGVGDGDGESVEVASGWSFDLVRVGKRVYSAGSNKHGQLGVGVGVGDGDGDGVGDGVGDGDDDGWGVVEMGEVEAVACGSEHGIAMDEGGRVWGWGWGEHGQVGTGGVENVYSPCLVLEASVSVVGAGPGSSFAAL